MNDRVREQLLGYLLGALEDEEQETLDQELKHDRTLRQQLAEIQHSLRPLRAGTVEYDPPVGLAERTCRWIASQIDSPISTAEPHPSEFPPAPASAVPVALRGDVAVPRGASSGSWSWLDLAVAASIMVAGFLLIFPAIENSRFRSQVTTCQDNLRQLGVALVQYSQHNNGYFPYIPTQGRLAAAGVYAPTLVDSGYVTEPRLVVCPGSPVADNNSFTVPSLKQLQTAEPGEPLDQMRSTMGGSYGYSLGYTADGVYQPTRNLSRPMFALMADSPNYSLSSPQSLNHGGRGQNVLFEDGRVTFLPTPKPNGDADNVFLNDTGHVAAGTHQNDSVVSGSGTQPFGK
jgi:hypothetical protein